MDDDCEGMGPLVSDSSEAREKETAPPPPESPDPSSSESEETEMEKDVFLELLAEMRKLSTSSTDPASRARRARQAREHAFLHGMHVSTRWADVEHAEHVMTDRKWLSENNAQQPSADGAGQVLKVTIDGMDQTKFTCPRNIQDATDPASSSTGTGGQSKDSASSSSTRGQAKDSASSTGGQAPKRQRRKARTWKIPENMVIPEVD